MKRELLDPGVAKPVAQATPCSGCGGIALARDVYNVTRYELGQHGACELCRYQLQGRIGSAA